MLCRVRSTRRGGWRLWLCALLAVLVFLPFSLPAQKALTGAVRTQLALERLNVLASALMIGAHPDDENNGLLAYLARGRKVRTGYLSLTRGEGGQNLIGPEQGELLGLIRTQELLAARRIDGGEQHFTRAIDFGFSKSADETFAKWGHDAILADVVWNIRRFRPDVFIIGGTTGHGHHQANGVLGLEAWVAAADPARFPEQLKWVEPWQVTRVVRTQFGGGAPAQSQPAASPRMPGLPPAPLPPAPYPGGQVMIPALPGLQIDVGEFNPLLGFSYAEIGGMSRSMHRTQSMGAAERRGPSNVTLAFVAGDRLTGDLFDRINTTWNRLPGGAPIGTLLEEAARTFAPEQPEKTIPLLLKARPLVAAIEDPWAVIKLQELDEAIALCAGLYLDASTDRYAFVPGDSVNVNIESTNRSQFPISLERVLVERIGATRGIDSWTGSSRLAYNHPDRMTLDVPFPPDQPYSQPYWLQRPGNGFVYTVEDQQLVGLPENPPVLTARFSLQAGTERIEITRPVVQRYVDRIAGEASRPLAVVPPVAVSMPESVVMFPSTQSKSIEVLLHANAATVSGDLSIEVPAGWRVQPASAPFTIARAGEDATLSFTIAPPAQGGRAQLRAVARMGGREIGVGTREIAYPDNTPQVVFPPASATVVRADIRTLAHRIGYVMGAGDEMPRALAQMGCDVTLLGATDLARGDLARFDAIVTGVRAYDVRQDLVANQQRLLEYVRQGGTLLVQYVTADARSPAASISLGPYPLQIGRDRTTVEDAPVTFAAPKHVLLNTPNAIRQDDFQGWVQERGLNYPSKWDSRYETTLESHDPGEQPMPGGNLYARYGKGAYIFTAWAWFRQLPAGVPGAYKLFANFLSAGKATP
jgi:LmbE family N-acetylglucosaminyl deacetylase